MADFAWLAPLPHKNIGSSKSNLALNESIRISSRPGSAVSLHSQNDDDYLQRTASASSFHGGALDTKWKPHKLPKSALKGAWSHQQHSRPSSSRASSPGNHEQDVMAIYNLAKHQNNHVDEGLNSQWKPMPGRMQHRKKLHVENGDSVNKKLESNINNLQGALLNDHHFEDDENYQNAEFVQLSFTNNLHEYGDHLGSNARQTSANEDHLSSSMRPTSARSTSSGYSKERSNNLGVFHKRNKTSRTNLSRPSPSKSHINNNNHNNSKHHQLINSKGKSKKNAHKDQEFVIEDLEKDNSESTAGQGENGGELPTIVVDDIERPNGGGMESFKKAEDVVEARRRKLRMKMKHANAFKQLFDAARAQSMRAELDLDGCYNPEDIKVAKTEEKKELERENMLEALTPNLPSGLPLKSFKELKATKAKAPTYANVAEAGQYMMSPDSIKVMKETLDEKRQQLFGEQPWLLGRLALSKETSRFELPMDLQIMNRLTPMEYLARYCVISSRRRNLYKSTFQKVDKDRDGWLSYKDLIKSLKEIHVNYIDENEISEVSEMLNLDDSSSAKYNSSMFSGIAAFSERLVLHMRKRFGKADPFGKERLEDADFDNMKWKLRTVEVNPPLMRVLKVL